LATDGSDEALRAAGLVVDLQEKYGSKVVIFHSVEHHMIPKVFVLGIPGQYSVPAVDYNKIRAQYVEHGEEILETTKNMFAGQNGSVETRLIKDEEPEDYIKRIVEEENFDLVALGYKGVHSKLKRILLGTVASKIINDVNCDVLIAR